ncbi:phosphatidate cytidylyltransferase [Enterococcus hirae]|nr:phosphatidate cytidylyltransferase [Enterococcus hirae]
MKQRVITAVVALLLFIPILWFGGLPLQLTAAALGIIGLYELFHMKGLEIFSFEGVVAVLAMCALVLPVEDWLPFIKGDDLDLFYFFVMILLAAQVISKNAYTIDEAAFPVIATLYVGMGFKYLIAARHAGFIILLYALLVVWATDIGAYLIGRKFGKHKLAPDISPNKTIEGFLGGIASAIVVSAAYVFAFGGGDDFVFSLPLMLFLTAIFSVFGQFGDLVESAIKRHYGVKDSGKILPGHGGILDRFDSLLFVFPLMHLIGLF